MNLNALHAKRSKLDEQIRKAKLRERAQRERALITLARKYGLLELDIPTLTTTLAKVSAAAESRIRSDTAVPDNPMLRTPGVGADPETAGVALEPDAY